VQFDEPRACLLVRVQVACELVPEVRLPERDVPAPADTPVADVGAGSDEAARFKDR
jgi:hypothetical protein